LDSAAINASVYNTTPLAIKLSLYDYYLLFLLEQYFYCNFFSASAALRRITPQPGTNLTQLHAPCHHTNEREQPCFLLLVQQKKTKTACSAS
jgi:hypothetical protein